jgi:hypothetical protein
MFGQSRERERKRESETLSKTVTTLREPIGKIEPVNTVLHKCAPNDYGALGYP